MPAPQRNPIPATFSDFAEGGLENRGLIRRTSSDQVISIVERRKQHRQLAFRLRNQQRPFVRDLHNALGACGLGHGGLFVCEDEEGKREAYVHQHNLCKNAWACPVCAPKLSAARREVLHPQIELLTAKGYKSSLVTLTVQHHRGVPLAGLLDVMREAWSKIASGDDWKNWRNTPTGRVEYIKGFDLTITKRNGWHPHFHTAFYLPEDHLMNMEFVIGRWQEELKKRGVYTSRDAQHVSKRCGDVFSSLEDAKRIADYAANSNWLPSSEAIGMAVKRATRPDTLSPFELLAIACEGEKWAIAAWREYVKAMKGVRQVTTSRGFKLKKDEELKLDAVQLAALGPETTEEISTTTGLPRLLDAARQPAEARDQAVFDVLASLEAKDWRMLSPAPTAMPGLKPPPPKCRRRTAGEVEEGRRRREWVKARYAAGNPPAFDERMPPDWGL